MEQLRPKRLTEIFKFSHISNILPYYGYLHEWKVLMERLCTQSSNIWKNNLEAFVKWGENNKTHIFMLYDSEKAKSFISNFNNNYRFIKNITGDDKKFINKIHKIMNILEDDKLIQLSYFEWKSCAKFNLRIFYEFWDK